jgi:hypothetical protein
MTKELDNEPESNPSVLHSVTINCNSLLKVIGSDYFLAEPIGLVPSKIVVTYYEKPFNEFQTEILDRFQNVQSRISFTIKFSNHVHMDVLTTYVAPKTQKIPRFPSLILGQDVSDMNFMLETADAIEECRHIREI